MKAPVHNNASIWWFAFGYFAADPIEPGVFHRTVGLKDDWANVQKRTK